MLGAIEGLEHPSCVFPGPLKSVVSARFPGLIKDWTDPTGEQASSPRSQNSGVNLHILLLLYK